MDKKNLWIGLFLLSVGSISLSGAFITYQGVILYAHQVQSPEVIAYNHNCAVNGYLCNPLITVEWGIFVIAFGLVLMISMPLMALKLVYGDSASLLPTLKRRVSEKVK